jgi:DNA-binding NarL/FixJ family response regulator
VLQKLNTTPRALLVVLFGTVPERLRVLIVDDHRMFADALKVWLDRDPSLEVVGIAATGVEAVDLALAHDPDIVLMDVTLPDIDGFEATRRLREVKRAAKVIAVSGWSQDDLGTKVEEAGMVSYLSKDLIHETVNAAIAAAVRRP